MLSAVFGGCDPAQVRGSFSSARASPTETDALHSLYLTREELRWLLDGVTSYQKRWCKLEPITFRTLLLLMYGAGLRTSEPIRLACSDVDLADSTLTIRVTNSIRHDALRSVRHCGASLQKMTRTGI